MIINKFKDNLTYNIIRNTTKLGFEFQETNINSDNLEVSSIELSNLLEEKAVKVFLKSKNLNIFTTSQLIEAESNRFLT